MAKRYELTDIQCRRIEPLLPGKPSDPGRTGSDNHLFVNGCFGCFAQARIGATCPSVTASEGRSQPVQPSDAAGVWERVFEDLIKDRDNQYLMLDAAMVRAHQQATTGCGSGPKAALDPAVEFPGRTFDQGPHALPRRGKAPTPRRRGWPEP